jgi:hypothetical protein
MYEEYEGVHCLAYGCFYSSETGETSAQTDLYLEDEHNQCSLEDRPAVLVGGALYFVTSSGMLLRYDVLGGRGLSVMKLPPAANYFLGSSTIVMTASNGGLGLATFYDGILAMWSTETGPNGDAKWVLINLIHLGMLLPADIHMSSAWLSGFAEDANFIFLSTDDNGIFTIELNSLLTRKVCELGNVKHVFPYLSFYTPAGTASCASPSLFALLQL